MLRCHLSKIRILDAIGKLLIPLFAVLRELIFLSTYIKVLWALQPSPPPPNVIFFCPIVCCLSPSATGVKRWGATQSLAYCHSSLTSSQHGPFRVALQDHAPTCSVMSETMRPSIP